ncbi:hypothetical protein NLU13_9663 [Sarocladium strictum]|uniref:Zn(2)-C6 fungal-type domain-containing protein n=1 Tax=Sarocladium strictum TaxID=5046 RepID=A0AA39GAI4_SARSR|nr:hypothetical protein NLU13_9663 [Sarocladium strictum]
MSTPNTTTAAAPQKHSRVLACVLCQHRKIKCDRNTPCSNCIKANVTCTPSTPAPARKRRRPNQDLQERLARCEDLLKQYAGTGPPPGTAVSRLADPLTPSTMEIANDPPSKANSSPDDDSPSQWKSPRMASAGRIVKEDAGDRFMDSYVWATVMENLQAMRDIVDTEEPDESSMVESENLSPEGNSDLLLGGGEDATTSINDLQPDPVHAFRLWQLFLERVNPLLKVVHIPTLQPYVMDGAISIGNVPPNYQALIFAIYTISAMSVTDTEAPQMLGMSREEAMQRFSKGMKMALVKYDFMTNYDMAALQALVLYVTTLQGRYDKHATWILSGTLLRIAQKMGYHRDGEKLNLPPFETEMRRRIWWQVVIQDVKYAMISGLNHSLLPVNWDTKRPSNVNDADLYPGLAEPVQERDGPTEMAFVLIMTEIGKFMIIAASNPGFDAAIMGQCLDYAMGDEAVAAANMERYRGVLRDLDANLKEMENRFLDASAGNVHAAALTIRPLITSKLTEMLAPPDAALSTPQDRLMKMLVNNLEHNSDAYENMGRNGFLWFVQPHFQIEVFSVLTGLLAAKPTSPLADRAWKTIVAAYSQHPEVYDTTQKQYYKQALFTLKAWRAREHARAEIGLSVPLPEPECVSRLKISLHAYDSRAPSQSSITPPNFTQPPPQLTELDSFLGGYLDVSQFQWDNMWNTVPATSPDQPLPTTEFGALNMGTLPSIMKQPDMGPF